MTVGESGDAVTVHSDGADRVDGRGALRGGQRWARFELWRDRRSDGSGVGGSWEAHFHPASRPLAASRLTVGRSMLLEGFSDPTTLWRIDDPTAPGSAVLEGSFPSGLTNPCKASRLTVGRSTLWTDSDGRRIVADRRSDGSGVGGPGRLISIRDHATCKASRLTVGRSTWRKPWGRRLVADRRSDGSGVGGPGRLISAIRYRHERATASRLTVGRSTWLDTCGPDALWRDRRSDGSGGGGPGRLISHPVSRPLRGITAIGAAPCMIRVARGTTEIEGFDLAEGRILVRCDFHRRPRGRHAYLQPTDADARPEHPLHGLSRRWGGAHAVAACAELSTLARSPKLRFSIPGP